MNEPDLQFLARMILSTRENNQISSADARRLSNLSQFGGSMATTMPEERRSGTKVVQPPVSARRELVTD